MFGTPGPDLFFVQQGNDDTVNGLAGNDIFYFGSAFTGADTVDGDGGKDAIVLQGNYALTLSATNITEIESISLKTGAMRNMATPPTIATITTSPPSTPTSPPGQQLIVNGQSLLAARTSPSTARTRATAGSSSSAATAPTP